MLLIASGVIRFSPGRDFKNRCKRCSANSARSSIRSRSGGNIISNVLIRYIQILAKIAFFNHLRQVTMRCANNSHIDHHRLVITNASNLATFLKRVAILLASILEARQISSKNNVPPSATSKSPTRFFASTGEASFPVSE